MLSKAALALASAEARSTGPLPLASFFASFLAGAASGAGGAFLALGAGASPGAGAAASGAGAACTRESEAFASYSRQGQEHPGAVSLRRAPKCSKIAPSSSWAWEHPRARQQPWVRRPGRGRQRRARGQPASEHVRLIRSRARWLRRAREINRNGEENRHGKNDSVGVHVFEKAADRRRTHGRNDCTRRAGVWNLLLLGLGSIRGRVSLLLRSRGGGGSVGRGGGLCSRK
jgi:hypothetical protein